MSSSNYDSEESLFDLPSLIEEQLPLARIFAWFSLSLLRGLTAKQFAWGTLCRSPSVEWTCQHWQNKFCKPLLKELVSSGFAMVEEYEVLETPLYYLARDRFKRPGPVARIHPHSSCPEAISAQLRARMKENIGRGSKLVKKKFYFATSEALVLLPEEIKTACVGIANDIKRPNAILQPLPNGKISFETLAEYFSNFESLNSPTTYAASTSMALDALTQIAPTPWQIKGEVTQVRVQGGFDDSSKFSLPAFECTSPTVPAFDDGRFITKLYCGALSTYQVKIMLHVLQKSPLLSPLEIY